MQSETLTEIVQLARSLAVDYPEHAARLRKALELVSGIRRTLRTERERAERIAEADHAAQRERKGGTRASGEKSGRSAKAEPAPGRKRRGNAKSPALDSRERTKPEEADRYGWILVNPDYRQAAQDASACSRACTEDWQKVCRLRELTASYLGDVFEELRLLPECTGLRPWHESDDLNWDDVRSELRRVETGARRAFIALAADFQAESPVVGRYVESPPDPESYFPQREVLEELPVPGVTDATGFEKRIERFLIKDGIRWTRPPGKKGTRRSNRRNIHIVDWHRMLKRRKVPMEPQDPLPEQIEARKAAERSQAS